MTRDRCYTLGRRDHVRRPLDDLGTSFGPCHTEFVCDAPGGARLIEVNDRLIGDHDDFLLDRLLDDDLFERVLRVHLGERLPAGPPPVRAGHAVADSVITERAGVLRHAPPCGPLAGAEPGVTLGYWPLRQPGEQVTVTHSNRDYLGIITAAGPDRALVERSVRAARVMNHLRTPAAKGHDQPFAVIGVPDWASPWPRPGVSAQPVTIAGQLCTPKDVLARGITVEQLRAGDVVAFGLAGAYAWNISHHSFLMHPPPAFHHLT